MRKKTRLRPHHLLLLLPFVSLWVPFYNRTAPEFAGIPFFYWSQMAWIVVTVALLFFVYRLDHGGKA